MSLSLRLSAVLPLCGALFALAPLAGAQAVSQANSRPVPAHRSASVCSEAVSRAYRNVRGQVVTVTPATKANPKAALSIAHEAIPNFMEAMTMNMPLKTAADAKRFKKGSKIRFDLVLRGGTYTVENIKMLPASTKLKIAKS